MKKQELLRIRPAVPNKDLLKAAKEDRCIQRTWHRWGQVYSGRSYGTALYFTAREAEGLLVVAVYTRGNLAAGSMTPWFSTFIDVKNRNWISRTGARWSEAYIWTLTSEVEDADAAIRGGAGKDMFEEEELKLCNLLLNTSESSIKTAVYRWQQAVREEINKKRAQKKKDHWNRQMEMIPPLPDDFMEWAIKEATATNNFLFYKRNGKRSRVYCSHCEQEYVTDMKMEHNPGNPSSYMYRDASMYFCERCGMRLGAKAWNRQKILGTHDNLVIMQKAGKYIAFRQFRLHKNFKKESILGVNEKWKVEAHLYEDLRILADPKTFRSVESYLQRTVPQLGGIFTWASAEVRDYMGRRSQLTIGRGIPYLKNLREVLGGSGCRPEVAERFLKTSSLYLQDRMILAASKAYIEYLIRAGLTNMANDVVEGIYIPADENAVDMKKLLGIDGQQLHMLKKLNGTEYTIEAMQYIRDRGEKLDEETLRYITKGKISVDTLELDRTSMTLQRMMNYLRRQAKETRFPFSAVNALYRDYLDLAEGRGMDPTDEIVSRTPRLKELHDRWLEEKNRKQEEKEDLVADMKFPMIRQAYEKNREHFAYAKAGLVIITPQTASDIKREGRLQHHCVGASDRYMKSMNDGNTFILFLRKADRPKEPYYTLEVKYSGEILQSYGAYDRKPDIETVEPILQSFTRKIRNRTIQEKKKQMQSRILVTAG